MPHHSWTSRPPKRRKTAAESRLTARRCSGCGGYVPQGMSVCMSCGLDQETGLASALTTISSRPRRRALRSALACRDHGRPVRDRGTDPPDPGAGAFPRRRQDWQNYGWLCLAVVSGLCHPRLGAVHPGQIRQAPDGRLDPRCRDRRIGPGRHALDSRPPSKPRNKSSRSIKPNDDESVRHPDQAIRGTDRSSRLSRSESPSS